MVSEKNYAVFGGVLLLVLSVVLVFSGYMTQGTGQGTGVLSLQASGTGNVVATGEIEIESIPAGANVYVDEINKNVVTPVSLSDLAAGTHTIKLTKAGYQDYIKSVSIVAGASTELVAYLNPTGSNGNLVIDSSVVGTNVYVNDLLKGRTPLTLNGIAPGTYNIKLVNANYEPYITTAVVSAGQTTTVPYVVMNALSKGNLNLLVNNKSGQRVIGASVYVDNVLKGTITSSTQSFVVTGLAAYGQVHTLRIVKSGYTTLNDRFVTNDPRIQDWKSIQLVNVGDQGSIVVASNPVNANVYLDAETTPRGVTSTINNWDQGAFKITNVVAGTEHKITLKKAGYKDQVSYVVVPISRYGNAYVGGALNPLTPSTGSVTINARTYNYPGGLVDLAGTEVYSGLFSSYYGKTPKTISGLNTGTNYTIVLRKAGYYDYVTTISPFWGGTTSVNLTMERLPSTAPPVGTSTLAVTSNPSSTNFYMDGSYKGLTPITTNCNVGNHNVLLRKQGYNDYTTTKYCNSGANILSATLTPINTCVATSGDLYYGCNNPPYTNSTCSQAGIIYYQNRGYTNIQNKCCSQTSWGWDCYFRGTQNNTTTQNSTNQTR